MKSSKQKIVLIAVLDWGLGHAGRSIPLIAEVKRQGVQVILAGSGRAGYLLRDAYPEFTYLECPGYKVHYKGTNFYWNILRQLPKIAWAVVREKLWLNRLIRNRQIDAIISDSRFGCFHRNIPSVIMTHQLCLRLSPPILSKIVNWCYHRLLSRFDAVWVPDQPNGLSGALSYPSPFKDTRYLGCLSRFQPVRVPVVHDLLVLLSGPEPQRTKLEELVLFQLQKLPELKVLVVQGKTDIEAKQYVQKHIELVSYLSGGALQRAIAGAKVVLCRSGYSSLMDLAAMEKKAILVPTPGQPEQAYLARRCCALSWACVRSQENLEVENAFREAIREAIREDNGIGFEQAYQSEDLELTVVQFLGAAGL